MDNQNSKIEITYGNDSLKEICNDILKEKLIKLFNNEKEKV